MAIVMFTRQADGAAAAEGGKGACREAGCDSGRGVPVHSGGGDERSAPPRADSGGEPCPWPGTECHLLGHAAPLERCMSLDAIEANRRGAPGLAPGASVAGEQAAQSHRRGWSQRAGGGGRGRALPSLASPCKPPACQADGR